MTFTEFLALIWAYVRDFMQRFGALLNEQWITILVVAAIVGGGYLISLLWIDWRLRSHPDRPSRGSPGED